MTPIEKLKKLSETDRSEWPPEFREQMTAAAQAAIGDVFLAIEKQIPDFDGGDDDWIDEINVAAGKLLREEVKYH